MIEKEILKLSFLFFFVGKYPFKTTSHYSQRRHVFINHFHGSQNIFGPQTSISCFRFMTTKNKHASTPALISHCKSHKSLTKQSVLTSKSESYHAVH